MNDNRHQQILELRNQIANLEIQNWLEDSFLQWHWWLLIIVFVLVWLIWFKLVDKKQFPWIFGYGLLLALINCVADESLVNIGLYAYPHRTVPVWNGLILGDMTIPPVIYMVIYQKFKSWRYFLIYGLIAAAILTFIGEPLLKWAGVYEMYHWSYFYSFPLYLLIAVIPKIVFDFLKAWTKNF